MSTDPFHQIVSIDIDLKKLYKPGQINRRLKELGATLNYDVYSFDRPDKGPIWQSESYIYVILFYENKEVDAQDEIDRIQLEYPLATIGSEYISKFAEMTMRIAALFKSEVQLNGHSINKDELISHCENLISDLMDSWGEEAGSESLRIMIENNYD